MEQGEIEKPFKPMIRIGMPVYDSQNKRKGILLLNYFGQFLLNRFIEELPEGAAKVVLLNRDGYWLYSERTRQAWGFMFDKDEVYASHYPQAWQEIISHNSGSFLNDKGLFVFHSVHPLLSNQISSSGSGKAFAPSALSLSHNNYVWKVVSYYSPEQIKASSHNALTKIGGSTIILLLIGFLVSWLYAKIWLKHELSEAKAVKLAEREILLDSLNEGVFGLDFDGVCTFINPAACLMLGYKADKVIGHNIHKLIHHHHQNGQSFPEYECSTLDSLKHGAVISGESHYIRENGLFFPVSYASRPVFEKGEIIAAVVSFTDITEKKQAEEKIYYLAFYDELTRLPNRVLLNDRMRQLIDSSQRLSHKCALVLLNIDRFTNINAAHGHHTGDQLLKAVADKLNDSLFKSDTVARLAADEFAIILQNVDKNTAHAGGNILRILDKIHSAFEQPFIMDGIQFTIPVSLGITLFPLKLNEDPLDIIRRSDTALHQAKKNGGNQSIFFENSMTEYAEYLYQIERELHHAIKEGELCLFLQPQTDKKGKILAAEVLVRWQHPVRGLVSPGLFIPIAEESDLIIEIGNWVLKEALELMAQTDKTGKPLKLSVNLSPRQFRHENFVPWIKEIIATSGADPNNLTLEVTEGLFIDSLAAVITKMNQLTPLGIHFSIDDFGTGYSSLSYLKQLPIYELKIDRIFIKDAPDNSNDAALVETFLAVSKHMNLKVVAEGVETKEQADFLYSRNPSVIYQGYFYGKPEPAGQLIKKWYAD